MEFDPFRIAGSPAIPGSTGPGKDVEYFLAEISQDGLDFLHARFPEADSRFIQRAPGAHEEVI